jgi:tetraprenyl-beta-curcumene synthase
MEGRDGEQGGARERLTLAGVFIGTALRYWLTVFPGLCREHRRANARARAIPDPVLRGVALDALRKWGNIEGAAAFAASVPRQRRNAAARAMACFQSAYNYLDTLSELPNSDPMANARRLHEALLVALEPGAPHGDYYAQHHLNADGGYLIELVDRVRAALAQLPSYGLVAPGARRAAERIVAFQSCNTGELEGDYSALAAWARAEMPEGCDLRWWEIAASGGSSLCVYALIAAGARSRLDAQEITQIEHAYFPWIGALHSLLDNLVDVAEDHATGQRNLIGCYTSTPEATTRMRLLAERSLGAARELPGYSHSLILAAMASFYLSTPEASLPAARPVARAVLGAVGQPAALARLVFRLRLRLRNIAWTRRPRGAEVVLPDESQLIHEFVK